VGGGSYREGPRSKHRCSSDEYTSSMGGVGGGGDRDFLLEEQPVSRRGRRRRWIVSALSILIAAGVCVVAFAAERSQFEWSAPYLLAPATLLPGTATGYRLAAVSCGAPSMCVAVDGEGGALISTDPAGGGETWHISIAEPEGPLTSIACPASTLCVIGDQLGNLITSTDPASEAPTWTVGRVGAWITDIACAGASLCVAVDAGGDILTSTNPFAGASGWRSVAVDPVAAPLTSVSCATTTLCVATDAFGNVLTSQDPTGGAGSWEISTIDEHNLTQVSCPTVSLCVALDEQGHVFASTQVAEGGRSWKPAGNVGGSLPSALSCPGEARCVALDGSDALVSDFPNGGSETWLSFSVSSHSELDSISCPTVTQCVAVDYLGHAALGSGPVPTGTLTVSMVGGGRGTVTATGIDCPGVCSASYARGTPVTLYAAPAAGSTFSGWGGRCTGSATCTISVERATELAASFGLTPAAPGFVVAITIGGAGSVVGPDLTCPPECRVPLGVHQEISFTARPSPGWYFRGWSGACTGVGQCKLTGDESKSLRALFDPAMRVWIPRIHVERQRKTAVIDVKSVPANLALLCALKRRGAHDAIRYRRCRSRIVYQSLKRGVYVFILRARSHAELHASRAFLVR
jgi:hypothetical protein